MYRALHRLRHLLRQRLDKWLFRLGKYEQGEVFLHQRRVFIVPSRPGLAFSVLLIVLFIGSVNYNLSLGFALTFLVTCCALVNLHLTFRNLAYLYLRPGRVQPVFAGEEAQFELHLINRHKHDRYAIWLGFVGEKLPALELPVDIAANAATDIVLATNAKQRGWLPMPRIRLQTRFPLGLVRAWSYWQPDVKALVYPRPEDNAPPLPMMSMEKQDGHGLAGHDDFAGVRAYQAGDSFKLLAWRQIAKIDAASGGTLISKHFEGGATSDYCIDLALLPRNMDIEQRLSRMTRWVLEAEARGQIYAFRLGDTIYPPAIGPAHQEACLRALALFQGAYS